MLGARKYVCNLAWDLINLKKYTYKTYLFLFWIFCVYFEID